VTVALSRRVDARRKEGKAMLKEGTYRGIAREFRFGKAATGTFGVVVAFELTRGEHAGEVHVWRAYFTEDSEARTLAGLQAAGYDGSPPLMSLRGLGSVECMLVVKMEQATEGKNAGKFFPRIAWVNALPSVDAFVKTPMTPEEIAHLGERMGIVGANGASRTSSVPPIDDAPMMDESGAPF
jgi:hypothetical protein